MTNTEGYDTNMGKAKKSSLAKKLLIVFGSLFGLFLAVAIIAPLVIDVDKYRPQIVEKANERLNGKLELGKLGLSLWGRVKIDIDGLKLSDAAGNTVLEVKDAGFDLPLLSLLTGRPEVRIHMVEPLVNVVKSKAGKLNVLALMKEQPAASSTSGTTGASGVKGTSATPAAGKTEVPAIVMNSRITVLLDHAKLNYRDLLTGDNYKMDVNFRLEDVSPSSDMPFELTANLDLLAQQHIKVVGPLTLEGDIKATSSGGEFQKADVKASLKLDELEITDPGLFEKKKGVALGADLAASVSKDTFSAEKIKFRLADVVIDGSATGKTVNNVTNIDFEAHSNKIDLAKLGALSPLITQYNVNGIVELAAGAQGPTDKLGYTANLKFNKIMLNNDALKQPLEVDGALAVATNELKSLSVKIAAAKGFDLSLNGSMQNFLAPHFKFKLTSSDMDLDGLLKASEKAAEKRKEAAQAQTSGGGGETAPSQAPVVDYNAMFAPLRKNPIAAAANGTFDFSLKRIKSTGVTISDLTGQLALDRLILELKDFSMKIFDGSIKGKMSFNARSAKPEVATNIALSGLQTQKMVEESMPIARNTIKGGISAALNIGGAGLNQSDIIAGWKGNGSMDIKDAIFSTLDVGREVKNGVIAKLPPMIKDKAKINDAVLDKQGKYQNVGVKFALANGVMNINDINGKAYPNEGLDLKGSGTVHLADYGLSMGLDIIDTYNLFHLDEHVKDKRYGHFTVSPKVGGTLFSPKFDWGATVEQLAKSALQQEGRKQAENLVKQKLGNVPGAGNVLNKVFGGGGGDQGGSNNNNNQPAPKPADAVKALKGLFGH